MKNKSLNYLEYPSASLEKTKAFFASVFGWSFTDYGEAYCAFSLDNVDGGFYASEEISTTSCGAALTVFYSDDLTSLVAESVGAGGIITQPVLAFPGGHRFHFTEPGGSEFAAWSDCYQQE